MQEAQEQIKNPFTFKEDSLAVLELLLRQYQERAVKNCIKVGCGTVVLGTGGGKTLIMANLIQTAANCREEKQTALIILPANLIEQTYSDFLEYGLLEKDWDVAMQYFFLLDGIQHVFFQNKLKIMDHYMKFNTFVADLSKKLDDDVVILIISDHGQKKGVHTDYGFYSSNKKLGLDNPKINDFKDLIEKIVGKNKKI